MSSRISLSVCRDVRRVPLPHHGSRRDKSAASLRAKVIEQGRFGRRCYFCDFAFGKTEDYEIHHLDGDHTNSATENLVPICELCHAPFHIEQVTKRFPGDPGRIIFLPELTQEQLNNLLQALFYSIAAQTARGATSGDLSADAGFQGHTVYRRLADRGRQLEELGEVGRPGLADPFVLSRVLFQLDEASYDSRDELLSGCRYLAPLPYFVERAAAWSDLGAAFSTLDTASWARIAGVSE